MLATAEPGIPRGNKDSHGNENQIVEQNIFLEMSSFLS